MHQDIITTRQTLVGVYCIVTREKCGDRRWTVHFKGELIGRFRTRSMALQFAENRIWAAMRDMVAQGGQQ